MPRKPKNKTSPYMKDTPPLKVIRGDVALGRVTLKAYCEANKLNAIERRQQYTITDAITALLHLATHRGFDAEQVHESALNHYNAERVHRCGKCGRAVAHENAIYGYSAGGDKYFCTEACLDQYIKDNPMTTKVADIAEVKVLITKGVKWSTDVNSWTTVPTITVPNEEKV